MNTIANARNSSIVTQVQQEVPVLRATEIGDEKFVEFITRQATSLAGAPLVVAELEKKITAGYRLDAVLRQILAMARSTARRHPQIAAVFH